MKSLRRAKLRNPQAVKTDPASAPAKTGNNAECDCQESNRFHQKDELDKSEFAC